MLTASPGWCSPAGACLGDFAAIVADIWQATILTLAL